MSGVPCINPTCVHQFTSEEVRQANVLKCPRCGQEIHLRTSNAPAAPPPMKKAPTPLAKPVTRPPVPLPPVVKPSSPPKPPAPPTPVVAKPVPISRPPAPSKPPPPIAPVAAPPVSPQPTSPVRSSPPPPSAPRSAEDSLSDLDGFDRAPISKAPRRSSGGYGKVFAVCFILLGSILAVFLGIRRFGSGGEEEGGYAGPKTKAVYDVVTVRDRREPAFEIVVPKDKGWTPNGSPIEAVEPIKKAYKAQAVWHNTDDEVWLAVSAADFDIYEPREAEMIRTGLENLGVVYEESLEMDQLPRPSTVAGKDAKKLVYKGRFGAVIHWGELHLLSHHGIGYWVYLFGPDLEKCQKALTFLEENKLGVKFADKRDGWHAQKPKMETFASLSGRASLTVPHGLYEKAEPPKEKDVDIPADLYLLGRYRKEKDNRKNAHVQVIQLEAKADLEQAMKRAKEHLVSLASAGGATGYSLILSPDAEDGMGDLGKAVDIDGVKGQIGEFCMTLNDRRERLYVVAVVLDEDRVQLVSCDVVWDHRQIWHQDFHDLVRTLKLLKK